MSDLPNVEIEFMDGTKERLTHVVSENVEGFVLRIRTEENSYRTSVHNYSLANVKKWRQVR